jgi:Ca2+-binding RTX toxin-like protein
VRTISWIAALATAMVIGTTASSVGASASNPCAHPTKVGTAGTDHIRGTTGDDVIDAKGGDDTVHARGGNDVVCGGLGDDYILGGRGNDRLYGGNDADLVYGAAGEDTVFGQDGTDQVHGGPGDDPLVKGGPGYYDKILGEYGDDGCLDARDGGTYDHVDGGPGHDTWAGDSADDEDNAEHKVASCP